jgi:hypothetical protein
VPGPSRLAASAMLRVPSTLIRQASSG